MPRTGTPLQAEGINQAPPRSSADLSIFYVSAVGMEIRELKAPKSHIHIPSTLQNDVKEALGRDRLGGRREMETAGVSVSLKERHTEIPALMCI